MPHPGDKLPLPTVPAHHKTLLEGRHHELKFTRPSPAPVPLLPLEVISSNNNSLLCGQDCAVMSSKDGSTCTLDRGLSKHEHCLEDLIHFVRGVVCEELSSMNQKLDTLTNDVRNNIEKMPMLQCAPPISMSGSTSPSKAVSIRTRSPSRCTSPSKVHSEPPTPASKRSLGLSPPPSPPPAPPPILGTRRYDWSTSTIKFKKLRTKIRFIGTLVAAAKRAKNRRSSMDSMAQGDLSRQPSITSINAHGIAHMMSPTIMWDSEAGARMRKIQKFLNADKSKQTLRMKIWQMMESPFSSKFAYTYAWIINILVVSSVVVNIFQADIVDYAQLFFEVLFAIEFLVRLVCCPSRCSFICSGFNWIDMLAVVPLGFRLSHFNHTKTVLALVPMVRLFKPLRRFEKLRLMVDAFKISLEALPLLLYTAALIAIVFAEIMYFLEPRSNIEDLPSAIWFTMVTMTTVGYGDVTPTTAEGHVAAAVLMVISALYMAMPLGIVGDAFSRVWADRDRLLVMKRFRGAFLERGFSLQSFEDVFTIFDEDASGTLDVDEFTVMLKTMQMRMTEERINVLFATLDKEGEGQITLKTLLDLLAPKALTTEIFREKTRLPSVSINPLTFISSRMYKSRSQSKSTIIEEDTSLDGSSV